MSTSTTVTSPDQGAEAAVAGLDAAARPQFSVELPVFTGPFDLLLSLIAKHKLDITEVALAQVTDEFVAYCRALEEESGEWDLDQASEFLVIAATLLELKAARLLPNYDTGEIEDFELLEARDLLFAKLLQYKAFKVAAQDMAQRLEDTPPVFARQVPMGQPWSNLLPELVWALSSEQFAALAARVFADAAPDSVRVDHVHAPTVSMAEQTAIVSQKLRSSGQVTFRDLVSDATNLLEVVARFMVLLELYRADSISFEQVEALGQLTVRWNPRSNEEDIDADQ